MKAKSIIEVVVVFLIMKFFSFWFDSVLSKAGVDSGWRTFLFGLQGILIPIAIIAITKRKWSDYGFQFMNIKRLVHFGFIGAMLMLMLGLGFGYLKSQGIGTGGMHGSLILSVIALIMILSFIFIARDDGKRDISVRRKSRRFVWQLAILLFMVTIPIIVAIAKGKNVPEIIAWDLYFLIMVGFGEEIKFRGYFQSRINQEYGRPWKILGISFGPGLFIVSLLFGLSHIIQFGVFNPFLGQFHINPWMGLQAFFGGLFFGLIREKSNSLVASGIAHGVPNVFGQVLAMALK